MSYMLGMISSYHDVTSVLIAVGITLVVVIGVTLVSIQTKYDFTNCWLLMICLSFAFLGFGIACAVASAFSGPQSYILQAVYGGVGAVLMSMFLAIDTQMLIGGKRKLQFSPEDYIFAALQIYLDICYIFMYVLTAIGAGKR
jgi:protein lifeguard